MTKIKSILRLHKKRSRECTSYPFGKQLRISGLPMHEVDVFEKFTVKKSTVSSSSSTEEQDESEFDSIIINYFHQQRIFIRIKQKNKNVYI